MRDAFCRAFCRVMLGAVMDRQVTRERLRHQLRALFAACAHPSPFDLLQSASDRDEQPA